MTWPRGQATPLGTWIQAGTESRDAHPVLCVPHSGGRGWLALTVSTVCWQRVDRWWGSKFTSGRSHNLQAEWLIISRLAFVPSLMVAMTCFTSDSYLAWENGGPPPPHLSWKGSLGKEPPGWRSDVAYSGPVAAGLPGELPPRGRQPGSWALPANATRCQGPHCRDISGKGSLQNGGYNPEGATRRAERQCHRVTSRGATGKHGKEHCSVTG